jgi:hypothetical protein
MGVSETLVAYIKHQVVEDGASLFMNLQSKTS